MHVRGPAGLYYMTHLVERRFEKFLKDFRVETKELWRRLMKELESIFDLTTAIARENVKTQ
jgi:hypothetical protein